MLGTSMHSRTNSKAISPWSILQRRPSVFLKKMQFVREYGLQDGVSVPQRLESKAEVRFIGPVELNIDYLRYSKEDEDTIAAASDQQ